MMKFIYTARTPQGALKRGNIAAASEDEAITLLQQKGFLVTFITADRVSQTNDEKKTQVRKFHSRLKIDDLILFGRQLATLLDAGVTLLRSLDIIHRQIESKPLYLALEEVRQDVERGETFSKSLEKHPKIFSNFWINLVETGEASGNLPMSLNQLVRYLESSGALRRKLVSALIYPSILILVSVSAIGIFMTNVIPIFSEIFEGFGLDLPPLTQMIVNISDFTCAYFLYEIIGIAALFYGIFMCVRTKTGKHQFDMLKFNVPLIGSIVRQIVSARFAHGLGTLMKSGVPILHALEIVGKTSGNTIIEAALDQVREDVREGKSMAAPLEESGIFPLMVTQMIAVGEEIGELSKMLDRISEFYEERVEVAVTRLTTLIEPVILVVMGGVIGVLVVAMFLPIFQISTING